jgi:hypothetical protein
VFQSAFRVTEISDDCYQSTMGGIVRRLRTPWSGGKNFRYTWEHLGVPATSLGAQATSLRAPATGLRALAASLRALATSLRGPATRLRALATTLGAPATSLGAPRITVEQSEKNIFFGNAAGAPGNHSYYLSFNDY